tara:strand:+ start:104 stop:523 length:420 start_codon:yes stop_codon:yes gene_type:complete
MESKEDSLFEKAMARYKAGEDASDLLEDFKQIVDIYPGNSAGWTCLAWLQLLCNKPADSLKSARIAVKLNAQDPQARINLSLALLETNSKGVRDHIDLVKRGLLVMPELEKELKISIEDGLTRKPDWAALKKIKNWLNL